MTGSCAEFYFPPLRRLLEQYILQTTEREVNLAEDSTARFKAVQENTHVFVSFFDLRSQCYHDKVLKPVFGVSDYYIGTGTNLPLIPGSNPLASTQLERGQAAAPALT